MQHEHFKNFAKFLISFPEKKVQFPMNISKHLAVSTPFLKIVTFAQSEFYSELKQDIISDEEYEKSK